MGRETKRRAAADEVSSPDEELEPSEEETKSGPVEELIRKMMGLGLSGFFTTEAALRGALGDTVPREWVDFVAEQSERTREEFTQRLAEEFGRVLEDVDLVELAEQLLSDRTIEVKAEFRLGPRNPTANESQSRKRT